MDLMCYSDASYGSNLDDRRSYSGYIILLGGAVASWCSQKQRSVAVSMAPSVTSRQLIMIKRGLDQLRQNVKYPVTGTSTDKEGAEVDYLLGDNQ